MQITRRIQAFFIISLMSFNGLVYANSQQIVSGEIPTGVRVAEWQQIKSEIMAVSSQVQYQAQANQDKGYTANNPQYGWTIDYSETGQTTLKPYQTANKAPYQIGIKLSALAGKSLDKPQQLHSDENKFTYRWNDNVTEWWVNSEAGIEQWFKIERPATSSERTGKVQNSPILSAVEGDILKSEKQRVITSHLNLSPSKDEESTLTLTLELDTDLAISQQGNQLNFTTPTGKIISYNKLKVWDATGTVLASKMQLSGKTLSLIVADELATYPVTIDPSFIDGGVGLYEPLPEEDILDVTGEPRIVAFSGDTMVVSTPYVSLDGRWLSSVGQYVYPTNAGRVSIYIRGVVADGSVSSGFRIGWALQQELEPIIDDAPWSDLYFGAFIAIDGDVLAVGNHIYTRTGAVWTERAQLAPTDGTELGLISPVAIDGGTIVVGEGYVFNRVGNTYSWSNQAQLVVSPAVDPLTSSGFSSSYDLAISGDTIVIGVAGEDGDSNSTQASPNSNAANAGAVYVFTGSGNSWVQQAYLKASNADAEDRFGATIDIDGDTIIVGASSEDSSSTGVTHGSVGVNNNYSLAGAAYIFTRAAGVWSQQAYLKASNTDAGDRFGSDVAIDGDIAVVGAMQEDSRGYLYGESNNQSTDSGAAYVFERTGNNWAQLHYLKQRSNRPDSIGLTETEFGAWVAVEGEYIAIVEPAFGSGFRTGIYAYTKHYQINVELQGLPAGSSVELNNFSESITVNTDGVHNFPTAWVVNGAGYNISSSNPPMDPNYTCTVSNGVGFVNGDDVTILVTCVIEQHTVGGNVTGLTSSGLVLQNNGGDSQPVNAGTTVPFSFSPQDDSSDYLVTVANQPSGQFCTVNSAYGTLSGSDINDVSVICHQNSYTVKGGVSGLNGLLVLVNSTGETINLTSDGNFVFQQQAEDSAYDIIVHTAPDNPRQICTVSNGTGVMNGDVTNVAVVCVINAYRVNINAYAVINGGPLNGLVLQNNGGEDLVYPVSSINEKFSFQNDGSAYNVSILSQPTDGTSVCTVHNGVGTLLGGDVTVDVHCSASTDVYRLKANVTGLLPGNSVVLQNNGGYYSYTDPVSGDLISILISGYTMAVNTNGVTEFPVRLNGAPIGDGLSYDVAVLTQPNTPVQTCIVSNESGTVSWPNNASPTVNVTCASGTAYSIGGTVTGLAGVDLALKMFLQGTEVAEIPISENGDFTFPAPAETGDVYQISVYKQPSNLDQTCVVLSGNGTVSTSDIDNIKISCTTNTYTVGGMVTGFSGSGLDLRNVVNNDNPLEGVLFYDWITINTNGSFEFDLPVEDGLLYGVQVVSSIPGETCIVTDGTGITTDGAGVMAGHNVTDIVVTCSADYYTVGGNVTGLTSTGLLLQNNGVDDLSINPGGNFIFPTAIEAGQSWAVTVLTQPTSPDQTCTVSQGADDAIFGDIDDVMVTCVDGIAALPGDCSGDGDINIQDVICDINIVLDDGIAVHGADCDVSGGAVNIQDVICIINKVLAGP